LITAIKIIEKGKKEKFVNEDENKENKKMVTKIEHNR
jgi:hypothetical protein